MNVPLLLLGLILIIVSAFNFTDIPFNMFVPKVLLFITGVYFLIKSNNNFNINI